MRGASTRAKKMKRARDGKFKELPLEARPKHPITTRNQTQSWSREDIRFLKELAKQNTPTRVMSVKLGRSVYSIRAKAREIQLSLKPINRSPYGIVAKSKSKRSGGGRSARAH